MAATGRMSRVHDAYANSDYTTPVSAVSARKMWGEHEPPREMSQLSPHAPGSKHQNSPGVAQGRWSQHITPGSAVGGDDEDGTPLRTSFQREDVGPGQDQIQDPDLHEQYFGVADGGEDAPGPSHHGLGLYDNQHDSGQISEDERGHWVQ